MFADCVSFNAAALMRPLRTAPAEGSGFALILPPLRADGHQLAHGDLPQRVFMAGKEGIEPST